ncbi:chorismate synthase [Fodinisporobacter ferrooxydans]|uniref:Chorismate synthase n=1 Tax=Fodinisporobacter ferrooxydans TaxID=2901836 RepID=A0ABY4CUJ7_9BACL|nr:chorismate synthase [Alicyclobacillaceae bacterium MYW30-H2]
MRYLTAGESHGPELTAIVDGVPSQFPIDQDGLNHQLYRRQQGYGRGYRMKIESDQATITSGVRFGKTLGTPITLHITNRDWKNWQEKMAVFGEPPENLAEVTKPRPGHADLAGALKYDHKDIRNVLERSSARNTATLVACGAVARQILEQFGIRVFGHVVRIGSVVADIPDMPFVTFMERAEASEVRCVDPTAEQAMIAQIEQAKNDGDTLGGTFEIIATGLPIGLGSYAQPDQRLDGRLAGALMGFQAIKGVEIGMGFEVAERPGSQVHDEIFYQEGMYQRRTNGAGGIEGGISNGQPIVIRAAMKPIPTLYKPLQSVDMNTKEPYLASIERSDTCAVPAAAVVGEAVVCWTLAQAFLEKFAGDSFGEVKRNYDSYMAYLQSR